MKVLYTSRSLNNTRKFTQVIDCNPNLDVMEQCAMHRLGMLANEKVEMRVRVYDGQINLLQEAIVRRLDLSRITIDHCKVGKA